MKKGLAETDKQLFWTFFALPTALIIATMIIFVIPKITEARTSIHPDLEEYLLKERLLSSSNCFAFEDSSSVYSNYIDIKKFNEDRLSCIKEKKNQAMLLVLTYNDPDKKVSEIKSSKFTSVHASSKKIVHHEPVIVVVEDKFIGAFLEIQFYR